jgi:hypothetical protein
LFTQKVACGHLFAFKREILAAASAAGPHVTEIVVDMLPVTFVDATGIYTTREVAPELERRGVILAAAGRQTEWPVLEQSRGSFLLT